MGREHNKQQGQGGPRQGGHQGEPRSSSALAKFKQLIQTKGFTDDEVMKLSEELGKSLIGASQSRGEREGKEDTKTQVRKFYNLVRVANISASAPDAAPETIKVKLRTLQAQVAYARGRKTIGDEFKEFFDASLNKVIGSDDLKKSLGEFATFFESLYAYFYYHTEVKR